MPQPKSTTLEKDSVDLLLSFVPLRLLKQQADQFEMDSEEGEKVFQIQMRFLLHCFLSALLNFIESSCCRALALPFNLLKKL